MTATTQARNTPMKNHDVSDVPVAASTTIQLGTMVARLAGYLVAATSRPDLQVIGRAKAKYDNSAGAAGDVIGEVEHGAFPWENSAAADAITQAHAGLDCYAVDNQTVALTSGGGKRSRAGIITRVDGRGVWVLQTDNSVGGAALAQGATRRVRGVVFANVADLTAFTVASNDGLTYVEGDRVLLALQTTAAECGVYRVGAVATGAAPLTRVADLPAGAVVPNGVVYEVSEGTIWAGSSWKAMCTGTAIVGTNDPVFYPRVCKGVATLAAGVKALGATEGLFLFSTTKSVFSVTRNTADTSTATTGGYAVPVSTRTAGKSGVGAATLTAQAAAGTTNTNDVSTLDWLCTNW